MTSNGKVDKKFVKDFLKNIYAHGEWSSLPDWAATMSAALIADAGGETYNEFDVKPVFRWLGQFYGIEVAPAREGSVAAYVRGPLATLQKMEKALEKDSDLHVDEVNISREIHDYKTNKDVRLGYPVLRLWWD